MKNTNLDRRYGQCRLHDAVVSALWRGADPHGVAMRYGIDLRSAKQLRETLMSEPNRMRMQIDDDITTLADAITADTGINEVDATDSAARTLLRWYAGRAVRVPEFAHIRIMADAWAKSRMDQECDFEESD